MVIDTGVSRDLADSAYNERRRQCEEASGLLRDIFFNTSLLTRLRVAFLPYAMSRQSSLLAMERSFPSYCGDVPDT